MEGISKVFTKLLVNDYIKLHPKSITKNTNQIILQKLKEKLEGKCSKHGYIKRDSIEIYKITPGRIELVGLNGYAQYNIHFHAEICNPLIGSLIKGNVVNINKFGILAEAGFYSNSQFVNVLEVIIAKNSVNIVSDVDLEKIAIGDEVIIEVLGKKFDLGDVKLSIVGRVVKDVDVTTKKKKVVNKPQQDIDDEEVEEVVVLDEEEDEEAEEEEEGLEEEGLEEDEDDDEKSSKGGAFFSDVDSVAGDDAYNMYESDNDSESEKEDD